ncbi:hypothetical protein [Asticcacaulis solisilvae]|uniref:hypothetical protein n=1 Tax=Asticcacaulis solisilvae TaxID=1217274 RepID=UPI003FD848F2
MDEISKLQATLSERDTPETVLKLIKDVLPPTQARHVFPRFQSIIDFALKQRFGWSSMATTFIAPASAARQVAKGRELTSLFLHDAPRLNMAIESEDSMAALDSFIDAFDELIGKTRGQSDFRSDRLDRAGRKALGLSRRRYSKLFRLGSRLERKAARLREAYRQRALLLVGKAALAPRLTVNDFGGDIASAAFVAYYAARMKLRSEFTISGQQKPFDEISAALLGVCEGNPSTSWWAIAHVFPRADVLERLNDTQRGQLLGIWFDILQELADRLDEIRVRTDINVETMIVKRGNDSSTWNLLAGAWNRARDHWIALVMAMGMESLFDTFLPGKVMKLIAADVAAWHRVSGKGLHPDTQAWLALPAPWLVLRGERSCTRSDIEAVCRQCGIDPEASGWAAPKALTQVAVFKPTPELVHGVTVSNPYLADYLRRVGVFSGKPLRPGSVDKTQ